jgi:hypothetical protein
MAAADDMSSEIAASTDSARDARAFNEVLGFLEAEAGDAANFLDDVDLVGASVNQDNVELGLFFFRSSSSSSAASSSNGYRSSSGNAPLFFEKLGQFCSFQNGQRGEVFYDLCEISHFDSSFCSVRTSLNIYSEKPP